MITLTGMLWFDGDPNRSLVEKINTAMEYHVNKYGRRMPICLININDAQGFDLETAQKECKVVIRAMRIVTPGHLLLCEENDLS